MCPICMSMAVFQERQREHETRRLEKEQEKVQSQRPPPRDWQRTDEADAVLLTFDLCSPIGRHPPVPHPLGLL